MFESDLTRRAFIGRSAAAAAWAAMGAVVGAGQGAGRAVKEFVLNAREGEIPSARSATWRTWTYNGQVPGPEIRVREGDLVRVILRNELTQPTSIHWHGVPVSNAMDGVPGVTQPPVMPGESFIYEFVAAHPGTYFYHSHSGLQLDRGLYGPLIVEPADAAPRGRADREHVLMLDDWLDITPEAAYAQLQSARGMGGGMMGGYVWTINGQAYPNADPIALGANRLVRLRLFNATMMRHPMHLHGHFFTLRQPGSAFTPAPVKDTVLVEPMNSVELDFETTNPGRWLFHCHHVYHMEAGMARLIVY